MYCYKLLMNVSIGEWQCAFVLEQYLLLQRCEQHPTWASADRCFLLGGRVGDFVSMVSVCQYSPPRPPELSVVWYLVTWRRWRRVTLAEEKWNAWLTRTESWNAFKSIHVLFISSYGEFFEQEDSVVLALFICFQGILLYMTSRIGWDDGTSVYI